MGGRARGPEAGGVSAGTYRSKYYFKKDVTGLIYNSQDRCGMGKKGRKKFRQRRGAKKKIPVTLGTRGRDASKEIQKEKIFGDESQLRSEWNDTDRSVQGPKNRFAARNKIRESS